MNKDLTDEEVAARVQGSARQDFGILVGRYEAKMLRYARKFLLGAEDAKDAVQEVFIKAYKNIRSFDTGRRFSPWIYRIAHNEFINRGKKRASFVDLDALFPVLRSRHRADQEVEDKHLRSALDECLEQLGPKYREVLVLYYVEELGYKEISEVLRVPISTVGVRLKRARENAQKILKKQGYDR